MVENDAFKSECTLFADLGEQLVTIGMKVVMVTRKIREYNERKSMMVYEYKFWPVLAGAR